ncbi:unnamed protein product [Mytilus edulis]|uniref:CCHC-type domain-containing protein n=1 Tax=Mytilus edulis TaxID=6550 RepID=A0A8S3Q7J6_MYTED|nr:unnamed protein product [Mytilus edulis]
MPPAKPKSKNLEIPKGLKYDGSSSWKTFYTKFQRYADRLSWTTTERKDQLCWCLHGKAGRRDPTPNQDEPSYDYDSDLAVHAIGKTDTKSELSKQMEALHKQEIGDLKQQFQKQQQAKQFPAQNEVSQQPNHSASKPTSKIIAHNGVTEIIGKIIGEIISVNHHFRRRWGPIPPEKLANMACYFCHHFGHIQQDCPELQSPTKK